jgi:hypothetical protein
METILDEASRITASDRNNAYGHPALHHAATAAAFTAYLVRTGKMSAEHSLSATDWEMAMILDKVMRFANKPSRDALVDIAGYARCAEKALHASGLKDEFTE